MAEKLYKLKFSTVILSRLTGGDAARGDCSSVQSDSGRSTHSGQVL